MINRHNLKSSLKTLLVDHDGERFIALRVQDLKALKRKEEELNNPPHAHLHGFLNFILGAYEGSLDDPK